MTDDIIESIIKTKEIFPFKTKGILLAVSTPPKELERKRFELEFKNDGIEGILDGGHNTLAIALHILNEATGNDKAIRKIKRWTDLKANWSSYKDKVADIRQSLDFMVPIEVLVPAEDSEEVIEQFRQSVLDICAARNNNVQLVVDTKANGAGHYDVIKNIIDPKLRDEIIWKTNTQGRIPVRDLVALSWIGLSQIDLPEGVSAVTPVQMYSSKTKCMQNFVKLMEHEDISNQAAGKYELKSPAIGSVLNLLKDLPRLYDQVYAQLPDAYNQAGGKFGRITAVKSNQKKKPKTPFYEREVEYSVPEGFVTPLVYALCALVEVKGGQAKWKVAPDQFLKKHLPQVVQQYKTILEAFNFDPQKVGKNNGSYTMAKQQFEHCLLVSAHQASLV